MKIGTDAILFGAWKNVPNARTLLDIGAGTGLLCLMWAQKNPDLLLIGLEPEAEAATQAAENFARSPWSNRLQLIPQRVQDYRPDSGFDVMVSNPPFFKPGFDSPNAGRALARTQLSLNSSELIDAAAKWLNPGGKLLLMLPPDQAQESIELAARKGLHLHEQCTVRALSDKAPHLWFLIFGPSETEPLHTSLVIMEANRQYTAEFKTLCRDYYLDYVFE